MNEIITSTKNPKIKRLMLLQQKSAERRKEGVFIVEGCQEVMHCIHNGMQLITLYYCKSLWNEDHTPILPHATLCMEVTEKVYEKMAYRGSTEGLIAEVRTRILTLSDISLYEVRWEPSLQSPVSPAPPKSVSHFSRIIIYRY